ncbi:MAG: DUF4905 domain-containing protein [Ignavibacteriota bacterium]
MKLFERNKYKIKPEWVFNQSGNLWKFIFGGKDFIAGETRDLEAKKLYLFTLEIATGKKFLKDFLFEEGNYWVSTEGASTKILYLHRFEKPELPYHKNIIALDLRTGKTLWENENYEYFFSTEDKLFGIKAMFGKADLVEINTADGKVIRMITEEEYADVLDMKKKTDDDLYTEYYDYPKPVSAFPPENNSGPIITDEIKNAEGEIEYILKNGKLFFNYYVPADINIKDLTRKYYKNIFCIYDVESREKLYEDVLNNSSSFNVPDNFFCKDDYLYYLREKKDIVAIKI